MLKIAFIKKLNLVQCTDFDIHRASTIGISPGYLGTLNRANYDVRKLHDIRSLKLISITGAPITEDVYKYLSTKVKPEGIYLFNTVGGTDIAGSFCVSVLFY